MGLIKTYFIYNYGRKRGTKKYEDLKQEFAFAIKQEKIKERILEEKNAKCEACGWEQFRHGPAAECPMYPEREYD